MFRTYPHTACSCTTQSHCKVGGGAALNMPACALDSCLHPQRHTAVLGENLMHRRFHTAKASTGATLGPRIEGAKRCCARRYAPPTAARGFRVPHGAGTPAAALPQRKTVQGAVALLAHRVGLYRRQALWNSGPRPAFVARHVST